MLYRFLLGLLEPIIAFLSGNATAAGKRFQGGARLSGLLPTDEFSDAVSQRCHETYSRTAGDIVCFHNVSERSNVYSSTVLCMHSFFSRDFY